MYYTRIINPRYKREVLFRSKCEIFDYDSIARKLPKYCTEVVTENNSFGLGYQIRKYANYKKSYVSALIEHGYFFGEYVSNQSINTFASHIFTFGEIRETLLKARLSKTIHAIGPYIHYASSFLDELDYKFYKDKLGKTLLVFFAHSATGTKSTFDIDYIFSKIEEIRNQFSSVVISLFWSDISDVFLVNRIKENGYYIFCAGHRYDYFFLSRLKSMILLSNVTMSNNVGTHVGYCIYLNKPHWLVKQDITYTATTIKGEENVKIIKNNLSAKDEKNEISNALSVYSEQLTKDQIDICGKYFGFEYVKSPNEMLLLLNTIN